MNKTWKCNLCGASDSENDLEEYEVGMGYICPNCHRGIMREQVTYTLKQLKAEITSAIGTKAKPLNKCKIRWYNDAVDMIKRMKEHMTEEQYRKMLAWVK